MSILRPLHLALVGAGRPNVATQHYLPAMAHLENVRLVALCDVFEEGVRGYARAHDVKWYTDFGRLLADPEVEAVALCTPDWVHASQTVAAAQAGKHVLCEKPVVMSRAELAEVTRAVTEAGVIFQPAHMRRFQPVAQTLKQTIDRGDIGRIVYVKVTTKGAFFSYPEGSPYYRAETLGQFMHNGPHYVDLLCYLAGDHPIRVGATSTRFCPGDEARMQTDNYTSALVRFAGGAIGWVEQNLLMLNPRGYPTLERIQVTGTQGTLSWSSNEQAGLRLYSQGKTVFRDPSLPGQLDAFARQLHHFAECIRTRRDPAVGLQQAHDVMAICLGALESISTGLSVSIGDWGVESVARGEIGLMRTALS